MKAFLILENETVFSGESIGIQNEKICEIVFNTSMTGYLEVLTDPSYASQGVVMTYPLIGNYGTNLDDMESLKPWAEALIVRELASDPNNFRNTLSLEDYLIKYEVTGIQGVDTRAITKLIRETGTMLGMITCDENYDLQECLERIRQFKASDLVGKVSITSKEKHGVSDVDKEEDKTRRFSVALIDLGYKKNIVRNLIKRGCNVTIYPSNTSASEIIVAKPDGIMLSNGPGDPKDCTKIINNIRKLSETDIPIFAICLGHQLMALASGADTQKLKYGHRGGNHPVKDLKADRVYITSQNHGYVVVAETLDPEKAEVSHINMNDGTVEGVRYLNKKVFSVQFHPEAAPGPADTEWLFDKFIEMF